MPKPLHVAFVSQEYPPETGWGGIGSYTYEMANGLAEMGVQVSVICLALVQETQTQEKNLTIYRVRPAPRWERLRGGWRINRFWPGFAWAAAQQLRLINQTKPIDLIEYAEIRGDGFFLPFLLPAIKRVVRLHTAWIFVDELNKIKPNTAKKLIYWQEKQSVYAAHSVSSPSHAMFEKTLTWLPSLKKKPRFILPNPVDAETFLPKTKTPKQQEIVFIGRPEIRKGIETLTQALPNILENNPQVVFRLISDPQTELMGEPAQEWVLKQMPQNLHPRITFEAVTRDQLPKTLSSASLAVLPSLWENFPYAILEAMSCGLPVVVTRIGGLPEIVTDLENGLLVPVGNTAALSQAVTSLLQNPTLRANLGAAARQQVLQNFSRKAVLPAMLSYYQTLASQP